LTDTLADVVLGKKKIDAELLEDLETRLLLADVGATATQRIISDLTSRVSRHQVDDSDALMTALRENLLAILTPAIPKEKTEPLPSPYSILMVGINGAGKTTTIGKLAHLYQSQGKSVLLAAGDTFRAAAVEQLKIWGERNNISVISQAQGADSAAVIYDAVQAAKARHYDVLLADTAGRLHTQQHLLEELKKVKRVMQKVDPEAPHETWLVLDAGIGQNALVQAQQFHQALGLTGLILTKLDGTAKGGIIFAISEALGLPIQYIGVGEAIDDLRPFNAEEFVDALLGTGEFS
jgi:fused signal recognition particle receptor